MTKLPLSQPRPLNNARLVSNVPPSPLTKKELRNSNLKKCGRVPMVLLETILTELSSENLLLSRTFPGLLKIGTSQSSLVDMLSVISTTVLTSRFPELDNFQQPLRAKMENKLTKFIISQDPELLWSCSMLTVQLKHSDTHALNMPLIKNIPYT